MACIAFLSPRRASGAGLVHAGLLRSTPLWLTLLLVSGLVLPARAQNAAGIVLLEQAEDVPDGLKYRLVSGTSTGAPPELRPLPGRSDRWVRLDLGTTPLASGDKLVVVSENLNRVAEIPLDALRQDRSQKRAKALQDRTNLLPNGDFKRGSNNWQLEPRSGAAFLHVSGGAARISIANSGTERNALRLTARGLMLEQGQPYTLRFQARASAKRTIAVTTQLDTLTGDSTGLRREETLTPQWKEYVFRFTAERPATLLKGQTAVTFRYTPKQPARKVQLAGSFNQWTGDRTPMTFDGKSWHKTLSLGPGNHEYKFVVDDQWTNDPNAPLVDDKEGHMNNIVHVGYPNLLTFLPGSAPGTVEIKDVVMRLDNAAILPEMRTALTRASFKTFYMVQIPVVYKNRAVYDSAVGLEAGGKKFAPVTLSTANNGVAVFENVPSETPATVTVTQGSQSVTLADRTIEQTTGLISNVVLPDNWTGILTLPGVPIVRVVSGSGQTAATAPVVVLPSSSSSSSDNKMLYMVAGFLAALALIMVGVAWLLASHRRNQLASSASSAAGAMTSVVTAALPARQQVPTALMPSERPNTAALPEPVAAGRSAGRLEEGPRLIGVHGVYNGYTFTLSPAFTEIGRDLARGVALPQDHNVSRRHAAIQYADGEYIVTDEGSSNGTFINGVRLAAQSAHPLRPGDEVQFGASRFRFEA
jgi:hypothetical protein